VSSSASARASREASSTTPTWSRDAPGFREDFAAVTAVNNAVSLGVIETPSHGPEPYEGIAALHPIRRVGEISDVVDGILFSSVPRS